MNIKFQWLQKHQVVGFFLLTFFISWATWILGFVLFPEDELLQAPFFKVGIYAPTMVAIFISSLVNHKNGRGKAIIRWLIFGVFWLAAWFHIVLYAHVTSEMIINTKLILVGGITAALPAIVIACAFSSNEGVQRLLTSIIRPRGNPFWYLFAILIIPVIMALGSVTSLALGNSLSSTDQSIQDPLTLGVILLIFLNELVQAGGLPEEAGWRGFALPRLQSRFSPLTSSVILGSIWALWHGPMLIGMIQDAGPWRVFLRILMIGVAFTWLYNRTGGSLLAVMLLHASWNTTLSFLPRTDPFYYLMMLLITAAIVTDRMWEKLPTDTATCYREVNKST